MASRFANTRAAEIIRNGGVIAYPTDTIYGLGCDPYNLDAIERINQIKQRPLDKNFILLATRIEQLLPFIDLTSKQLSRLVVGDKPTSWIVPTRDSAPGWLKTGNTIAVRLCQQPDVTQICKKLGHAITSTSANPSGKPAAKNALELHRYFHHEVDIIITTGTSMTGKASRLINICDNHIIRE